ncbi:hypothetical protein ACP70R_037479 [Stipagrostis hirtigluma subsp. patula]
MDIVLPFKKGDLAESRSFSPGFRGAWFRSKISDMYIRQGHLECRLEYTDFPDEIIVLHEKPVGEGGFYDADCKDLRPALDWSLEKGWSVPLSQEDGKCWHTAYLISQNKDTGSSSSDEDIEQSCDGKEDIQKCGNGASDMPVQVMDSDAEFAVNNNGKEEALKCLHGASDMPQEVTNSKKKYLPNQNGKCCTKNDSSVAKPDESAEVLTDAQSSPICLKRRKTSTEHALVEHHTVDDAIMELEKGAHKIRRVKNLLLSTVSAPSNVVNSWKIVEKDASEKHK